jgi:hypothetical protein
MNVGGTRDAYLLCTRSKFGQGSGIRVIADTNNRSENGSTGFRIALLFGASCKIKPKLKRNIYIRQDKRAFFRSFVVRELDQFLDEATRLPGCGN